MEGLKNIFDMFENLCNNQQEKGCDLCPVRDMCEPQLYEKARKELIENGYNI